MSHEYKSVHIFINIYITIFLTSFCSEFSFDFCGKSIYMIVCLISHNFITTKEGNFPVPEFFSVVFHMTLN